VLYAWEFSTRRGEERERRHAGVCSAAEENDAERNHLRDRPRQRSRALTIAHPTPDHHLPQTFLHTESRWYGRLRQAHNVSPDNVDICASSSLFGQSSITTT
jgi:hypothetical protein